jgi:hypothetical protein
MMRKIKEYRRIYNILAHPIQGIYLTFHSFLYPLYLVRESGPKERRSLGYEEEEGRIEEEYQRNLQT